VTTAFEGICTMPDQHTHERETRTTQGVLDSALRTSPSSSRMLTSYLADIEQLLDEQHWEAALREAFALPQIAVALADPQLRSSGERVKAWCHEWVRPANAGRDAQGEVSERVCHIVSDRAERDEVSASDAVPALVLRRLRLRRLVRTPPRGFSADRTVSLDPEGADAVEICTALVEAARRWYGHRACRDATVQANLARLAVLR
jgi:hypothetical protein